MGAAAKLDAAVARHEGQRQQHSLQDQGDGARTAALAGEGDVEEIIAGRRPRSGREFQGRRPQRIAGEPRAAKRACRANRGQVLGSKAGGAAESTNPVNTEWPASDGGERERSAQDLSTALALRAVKLQRLPRCGLR